MGGCEEVDIPDFKLCFIFSLSSIIIGDHVF